MPSRALHDDLDLPATEGPDVELDDDARDHLRADGPPSGLGCLVHLSLPRVIGRCRRVPRSEGTARAARESQRPRGIPDRVSPESG
jgi:hypothetical protein